MITKLQMEKAVKGQMVKCGHIWQALYALKARTGLVPLMAVGSIPQRSTQGKGVGKEIGASRAGETSGKELKAGGTSGKEPGTKKKWVEGLGMSRTGQLAGNSMPAKKRMCFQDFAKWPSQTTAQLLVRQAH